MQPQDYRKNEKGRPEGRPFRSEWIIVDLLEQVRDKAGALSHHVHAARSARLTR